MERLGLGPDETLIANPGLIYGRITGWGQDGPLADTAGHDINYIAITGALDEIGEAGRPPLPPINLVGDFAGGSLFLALGIALALFERTRSGKGQVIDAAIVDGTASLLAPLLGLRGMIGAGRGVNQLGGASPTYRTYRCADGSYLAVGAIEEPFWNELADNLGLSAEERRRGPQYDASLHARLESLFLTAPRSEWLARLATRNSCVAPVLAVEDAAHHPHMAARGAFQTVFGQLQPAPAPRLSRTPGRISAPAPRPDEGGREVLERWGAAGGQDCTTDKIERYQA
jgi:alpha-methylacyl-CoA racemase